MHEYYFCSLIRLLLSVPSELISAPGVDELQPFDVIFAYSHHNTAASLSAARLPFALPPITSIAKIPTGTDARLEALMVGERVGTDIASASPHRRKLTNLRIERIWEEVLVGALGILTMNGDKSFKNPPFEKARL